MEGGSYCRTFLCKARCRIAHSVIPGHSHEKLLPILLRLEPSFLPIRQLEPLGHRGISTEGNVIFLYIM